ncbi:hypothetical protein ACFV2B_22365 [Streptomyces lavendulae]|uniref:hypothetical protein n=1 Tax=Streptomyces lavendulae TaxID=1914 RepID=UPI00369E6B63
MLIDVFSNWLADVFAGLTLLALGFLSRWLRRRTTASSGDDTVAPPTAGGGFRTYTLLGARAADGQPVHMPSSKPAGTVVTWTGPAGREGFELTDHRLPDGTYGAEPVARYQRR